MEVEAPCLLSESDGDDSLLERLYREDAEERAMFNYTISSSSSSSSSSSFSSSTSSSSEYEEDECYESRRFIERLAMNPCVSTYEMQNLMTAPRTTKKREAAPQHTPFLSNDKKTTGGLVIAQGEDRITQEDRKRRVIHIVTSETYVDVMIENYVYVSYFCNRYTGEKYRLGLCDTAIKMLPYGNSFSKSKFTKVAEKYLDGPSHYLFGSGVCVESGTYSAAIAYKTHHNTMRILRETCRNDSIAVKKRKCQNIVAKGTLGFRICLLLLKHKYPNYVEYDSDEFHGAIIRVNKIDADLNDSKPQRRHDEDSEDADTAFSGEEQDEEEEEEEDDDDDASSSSSYEYYEETPYEKKTCHRDFDYKRIDIETRRKNEALLREKPAKQKDLPALHNPDELNDYQVKTLTQKNVTILAFPKGRIICAGCKSDREVIKTYAKVIDMLATCQDNEQNRAIEVELLKMATAP